MSLIIFFIVFSSAVYAQSSNSIDLENLTYVELDSLANIQEKKGAYKEAIPILQACVNKSKSEYGSLDSIHLIYQSKLGAVYMEAGNYAKAEAFLILSLEQQKQVFGIQHSEYSSTLNSTAGLFYFLGEYEKSILYLQEAKKINHLIHGDKHPTYANVLNNLAGLYSKIKKYEEAKPLYEQSLEIRREIFGIDSREYGNTLNNLGLLYLNINDLEKAEKTLLEVKRIREKTLGKEHPRYSSALNNLALVYSAARKLEKVEVLYKESLEIRMRSLGEKHSKTILAFNNLATFYARFEECEKGKKLLLENIERIQSSSSRDSPILLRSKNELIKMYICLNDWENAFVTAINTLKINSTNWTEIFPNIDIEKGISEWEPKTYLRLMELEVKNMIRFKSTLNQLLTTVKYISKAANKKNNKGIEEKTLQTCFYISKVSLQINEELRNNFSNKKDQLRQLKEVGTYTNSGIAAAYALDNPLFIKEAFYFAEQNKSVLLADAVKGNKAKLLTNLPDSLVILEQKLKEEKDLLQKKKYRGQQDKGSIAAIENDLNERASNFIKLLEKEYPKYHELRYQNINTSVQDIQNLLKEKDLFLEYIVGDTATYLFAISSKKVKLYTLEIGRKEVKEGVAILRKVLSDYKFIMDSEKKAFQLFTKEATHFYNKLLKKALENEAVEHLIIVADAELGHLPFEVFLTSLDSTSEQKLDYRALPYLLKKYSISYDYSATLWKENQKKPALNNNHQILGFAPSYPKKITEGLFSARPSHIEKMRKQLIPLPAAEEELNVLSELFDGKFTRSLEANEAFFKKNSASYGVIHLAMHGIVDRRMPILSSLAFAENQDSLEDNFLEAYEIAQLKFNADLVVLSACETGYGQFQEGEGVLSLARSFMYAGVPSLVVSLWQVNDGSTALIMEGFYKKIAQGISKDKALQEAKLDYLEMTTGGAGHPAFWSPFIQLGDSRAIELEVKKNKQFGLWIALGVVLLLGILLLKRRKENTV